jgi:hypothetical protein
MWTHAGEFVRRGSRNFWWKDDMDEEKLGRGLRAAVHMQENSFTNSDECQVNLFSFIADPVGTSCSIYRRDISVDFIYGLEGLFILMHVNITRNRHHLNNFKNELISGPNK